MENANHSLQDLFNIEPETWGLRGDPYLWEAMKTNFRGTPMPESPHELTHQITVTFEFLTGRRLDEREHFFIEEFAHGGMSSGHIDPEWWQSEALPLLHQRFARLTPGNPI